MKKLLVCIFAIMLLSQVVEALKCYHCPNGGRCFSTATCAYNQDRCITLFFAGFGGVPPRYAKRCGKQYECDVANTVGTSAGMSATCCATDLCNG